MSKTDAMTNSSKNILTTVSDWWTRFRVSNTHSSKLLFCSLDFRPSGRFLRRTLFIVWERRKEAIETRFIWVRYFPSCLMFINIELCFFWFFLNLLFITSEKETSVPKTVLSLSKYSFGWIFSLNFASAWSDRSRLDLST